jgi:hypothetical protein
MVHVVRVALLGTPVANLRAQCTDFLLERAIARHGIRAQPTHGRALDATGRTIVRAFLADHVRKTVAAFGGAFVARGDAGFDSFSQVMAHDETPQRYRMNGYFPQALP